MQRRQLISNILAGGTALAVTGAIGSAVAAPATPTLQQAILRHVKVAMDTGIDARVYRSGKNGEWWLVDAFRFVGGSKDPKHDRTFSDDEYAQHLSDFDDAIESFGPDPAVRIARLAEADEYAYSKWKERAATKTA